MYYAAIERQREEEMPEGTSVYGSLFRRMTGKGDPQQTLEPSPRQSPPLEGGKVFSDKDIKEGSTEGVITETSVSRISASERENGEPARAYLHTIA